MKRRSRTTLLPARKLRVGSVLLMVMLGSAGGFSVASAEDEDTSSSVYLVFDPETGEFVTEDGHDAALPNQTGLEDSGLEEPANGTADQPPSARATRAVIVGLIAIVLAGLGFRVLRRRQAG